MKKFPRRQWLGLAAALSLTLTPAAWAQTTTTLKVFAGGTGQRPDLSRKLFDEFEKRNPNVKVQIETGGATSELQRQYLSTVLGARDANLDIFIMDIVNPAQYAASGWIEPLNAHLKISDPKAYMAQFLPAYATANVIDNKVVALPYFADALFLYYRKDLLDKYKLSPPATWDDVAQASKTILAGEKNPNLQGLSFQGAAIEGAVCTFLLPYWSQGKDLITNNRLSLDKPAAIKGLNTWLSLVDQGAAKKNIAEVTTIATVNEFKAGQVTFGVNWGFAWDKFKDDADSQVKGKVGVARLPAVAGGSNATCIGGWQAAVSAYSANKPMAARLVEFMASAESSKLLAAEGSLLPVRAEVYQDPTVLKTAPWFADALPVVQTAKSRPVSARYGEVSDVVRSQTNAVLARSTTPQAAVDEIEGRLTRALR